jgi:hypothetical protein
LALCDPETVGIVFPDGDAASPRSTSNRKSRNQEMGQLIGNKRSRPVLIATFRGSFRAVLFAGRVTRRWFLIATADPTRIGILRTTPFVGRRISLHDPMRVVILSECSERRYPPHPPFLIATVPNSKFALNPFVSETSPFSNRNKNGILPNHTLCLAYHPGARRQGER